MSECSVDEVETRQKGLWTMVRWCELRLGLWIQKKEVRTKERAKNRSIHALDSGDHLSGIEQAVKNERRVEGRE